MAVLGEARGWGLFNNLVLPAWLKVVLTVVMLDLVIYFQHVLFHAVPTLWRLHRMHHADLEFDVTTGVRFHPVEVLLSMIIKLGTVTALGAPALGVLAFEVLLNATSMFNHGNVRLPGAWTPCSAGLWSRPRCIASTTRSSGARLIATSGSTCPGGIGCSALTGPSPRLATKE